MHLSCGVAVKFKTAKRKSDNSVRPPEASENFEVPLQHHASWIVQSNTFLAADMLVALAAKQQQTNREQ
jgi:hypothetical protein